VAAKWGNPCLAWIDNRPQQAFLDPGSGIKMKVLNKIHWSFGMPESRKGVTTSSKDMKNFVI
jgi:hypothetical protein